MDITQEVDTVEKELLELIVQHLEANKLELATAQKLAKDFLSTLPIQDQKDLLAKLQTLGKTYPEAQAVYVTEARKINEMERDQILNHMRNAIGTGDIHGAIQIAKAHTQKGGVQ